MVKSKEIEHLENSNVKLKVTVDKDVFKNEYENLLKNYAKSAQLKGFRKGKVPPEVLERKYGEGIRVEAGQKLMEESLKEIFETIEEKPLVYSIPEVFDELEFDLDKDFSFAVTYDIYPNITLGKYKELEIEVPTVRVGKEDEERELNALQDQNSVVLDKESGQVEKENIVTIDYVELDDNDKEIENTKREDYVFTIGTGYNIYKIDDEIIGTKIGEDRVVSKDYPEDYEFTELAGRKVKLKVTVRGIKEKQLPEINDELAQDISDKYETLEDLKKDIKKRLRETADSRLRQLKIDSLMDKVLENSDIILPASMINAELESSWKRFVAQFKGGENQVNQMLHAQGRNKEELSNEWKPGAEKRIKKQLLSNAMIEKEKITTSDEEIDADLKKQAENGSMSFKELKDYYENNNMLEYIRAEITERKMFDKVLKSCSVKKGKSMKLLDLLQGKQ